MFGMTVLICDECETESVDGHTFTEAVAEAKDADWLLIKDDDTGEWTHLCHDCATKLPQIAT